MDLGISGKRALVLGGTKGLGRGIADALASEGATVSITGRDQSDAGTAARSRAGSARGFALDLTKPEALDSFLGRVSSEMGTIDVLVLNGGGPRPSSASEIDPHYWRNQFDAMVLSMMRITSHFLPNMIQSQWGRIIAVGSTSVREPISGLTVSNALRAALAGWMKTLATEVAPHGVTVNMMLPGSLATDRTLSFDKADAEKEGLTLEQVAARSQARIPAGRYGTPEEFGAVAAFLASQQASYITGVAISVDGGSSRSML
ncbi:MAG: 3-oxoacyl-ACP reductase [Rhizobium sp.]|nr:3-oxoacyl-ACP reductase [Rhizobium sp.]